MKNIFINYSTKVHLVDDPILVLPGRESVNIAYYTVLQVDYLDTCL